MAEKSKGGPMRKLGPPSKAKKKSYYEETEEDEEAESYAANFSVPMTKTELKVAKQRKGPEKDVWQPRPSKEARIANEVTEQRLALEKARLEAEAKALQMIKQEANGDRKTRKNASEKPNFQENLFHAAKSTLNNIQDEYNELEAGENDFFPELESANYNGNFRKNDFFQNNEANRNFYKTENFQAPELPVLPSITAIENIPAIFQSKSFSSSIKEFKNYLEERIALTGVLTCDGSALATDVHFYELRNISMTRLKKIRLRACPNISPFIKNYLRQIKDQLKNPDLILKVELTEDPLKTLNNLSETIEETVKSVENTFGPLSKSSISKILIYHANLNDNSLVPSNQMILNQYRKTQNTKPSLIEHHSVSIPNGEIVFLECAHSTLFDEFVRCFHPRMVFLIVTTAEDFLKYFFSLDCSNSFSILSYHQIRLITNKSLTDGKLWTNIHSQLDQIIKSVTELYETYLDDSTEIKNENDDFRRNHYLSSLLHLRTKCELLKGKLRKEHCLVWNSQDANTFFDGIIKESTNFSTTVYSLAKIEEKSTKKFFETDGPIVALADEFVKAGVFDASQIKKSQTYFSHKFIHGSALHLHSSTTGKSFCVSDISWFCTLLNNLFNEDLLQNNRLLRPLLAQIKQRIGPNARLINRRGLTKLQLADDETHFLEWLLDSWGIAYSFSIGDENENSVYALFNSISPEPPTPLSTIWPTNWSKDDYESVFNFTFLHSCDSTILLSLFKMFPSQKILLASRDFFIIQDGAIEVLLQIQDRLGNKHADSFPQATLTLSCRAINLYSNNTQNTSSKILTSESFAYIVRTYYVIVWSYLFKNDYVFKIEKLDAGIPSNSFDAVNGNHWMSGQWNELALYHYCATPSLKSPCSVCGLSPSANKALYNACITLSPPSYTTVKSRDSPLEILGPEDQSYSLLFEHGFGTQFNYTGKHCLRPEGYNSFEVIVLNRDQDGTLETEPVIGALRIGCLVNNSDIEGEEKVFFEYGSETKTRSRYSRPSVPVIEKTHMSHLDEIRSFGGLNGLKNRRNQPTVSSKGQELYNGLRLRIDVLHTNKTNSFEFVFSVNGIPWSHKIIRRKALITTFQPIVSCVRFDSVRRTIYLTIQHNRTILDKALIENSPSTPTPKPWKVGMRLEAKDRKNPSICAIANIIEVYEDNRIRINFDGWTSTYDYTVEVDHPDIHPCGFWEYVQRVLYKNPNSAKITPHFTYSRYDKPRGYSPSFSWRNYLTEIDCEPIPYECFNYTQSEGMPPHFFPHTITKPSFTTLSCRHYYNVRVKYQIMNKFVQKEIASRLLCEHRINGTPGSFITSPSAVILPTPIDHSHFNYPCLKHFQNSTDVTIHVTCNHRDVSPWDPLLIVSGSHLLDTTGNIVSKQTLSTSVVDLSMLTALDLSHIQKRPIAPCISKLITNLPPSVDKKAIEFHIRRWLELSAYIACFHSVNFFNRELITTEADFERKKLYASYLDHDLYLNLSKNLSSIDINYAKGADMRQESVFGMHGECYFCSMLRKNSGTIRVNLAFEKRLEIIDGYAPSVFYIELGESELQPAGHHLTFDDSFFTQFNGLEIIDVKNMVIDRFEVQFKNTRYLKRLKYLSLENNELSLINADFKRLNDLSYIKLLRNPFVSLPPNFFSSKALQKVEMSELGRLSEIDSNTRLSSELKLFIITESILTSLPPSLGLDARTKLTKLTLSGVSWWRPDGMSVNEVVKYESFEKKFIPFLDSQELAKIYHMYDEDLNGVLSFNEINQMNAHIYRYISRLKPIASKIPNSGRSSTEPTTTLEMENFKQDSFSVDPSGFPSAIFSLENLVELTIEYQGIKTVPDGIKALKSLNIFNLNYCIELETISPEVGLLPLKELNLNGCLLLKTPPIEIIRRGHTQTMAFLQRLISGSTACKRTKLMLVGLGGAGKTSLVRAFLRSNSDTPPSVTDGIDIIKWKVLLDQPNDFLEFSVWDFAGQSVYYHTHQFFLAKKAVYILAWNIRLGAEHAGLDFWLSSICCHAPNAPIFVVGTHVDQVSRVDLRQDDFKRRYPQIVGFFNVSTYTGTNVEDLIENIIKTTLTLPYMDEQIPRAWLNFETLIGKCKKDVLKYSEVEDIAHNAGIFESTDVLQSVQFLHDLGSLQYFPSEHLKNYVVINPQWIVNVMACIVSIKDSPVKDGRLFHRDINVIWENYSEQLHPWILKLTEAFDLTFPVPDQVMNLVPCLLPEEEPQNLWSESTESEVKELKVFYTFNYLPAGLFNRAQVRLFQFSDKSTIWRYGSLLVKNNNRAVVIRTDDRHIVIKIQGIRPDNILFLIHEVFEGLVNESFFGVTYDINFPCPDCLESRTTEPWQFSSSLINRATELKSPFIQCHRFFHVASVTDLQALIPPDSNSNYDLHLEYSVRDLKSYRQNIAVDIVYLFSEDNIPKPENAEHQVDPRRITKDLIKRGFKVWTPDSMKEFKIEDHYLVLKSSNLILFGISTEVAENSENQNLRIALQTIKEILRRPIIPIIYGNSTKWKESEIGVGLSDAFYISMQSYQRYDNKLNELIELITEIQNTGDQQNKAKDEPTDVFISYCWTNSHDAAAKGTKVTPDSLGWGDPRVLKDYLEARGLKVWMDIIRLGRAGVTQDIVHGLKSTKVVVACVSNEYTKSEMCRNEFLFAKNTLRLPMILGIFGSGDEWRVSEVGMCGLACSQVNFQLENPSAFEDIYNYIHSRLPKRSNAEIPVTIDAPTNLGSEKKTTAAYQELFELTQRKFLRLTSGFADAMNTRPYPRLFAFDFIGIAEKSAQELAVLELAATMGPATQETKTSEAHDLEAERKRDEEVLRQREESKSDAHSIRNFLPLKKRRICVRALCENEENWHIAGNPFEITEKATIQNSAAFLTRIMLLLKQSDLTLNILNSKEGESELQKLAEYDQQSSLEVKESYSHLRRLVMDSDPEEKYCGLKLCLTPSGKMLWLCDEHRNQPRIVLVTGAVGNGFPRAQVEEKSEILKALNKLNEKIAQNEIPPPELHVPLRPNSNRQSSERQAATNGQQTTRRIRGDSRANETIEEVPQEEEDQDQPDNAESSNQDDNSPVETVDCPVM